MSIKNDYFGITGLKDITVDIPLDIQSDNVGYKTLNEEEIAKIINFNLKSLIFTVPGERMDTNFGVGIKNYLFESADPTVFNQIQGAIEYQLRVYMPWLVETNVEVSGDEEYNTLYVRVKYKINRPEIVDYFDMSISLDQI